MLVSRYYFDDDTTFRAAIDAAAAVEGMPHMADHRNQCIVVAFPDSDRTEAALGEASLRSSIFVLGTEASEDELILGAPPADRDELTEDRQDGTWVPAWNAYV